MFKFSKHWSSLFHKRVEHGPNKMDLSGVGVPGYFSKFLLLWVDTSPAYQPTIGIYTPAARLVVSKQSTPVDGHWAVDRV